MQRLRSIFGFSGLGLIGLVAALMFSAGTADATTLTVSFTGTVTDSTDATYTNGQSVTGTMVFDPVNTSGSASGASITYDQTGSFSIDSNTFAGTGSVSSVLLSPDFLFYEMAGTTADLSFGFSASGSTAQLTSFSQLPTSLAGLAAYFGTAFAGGGSFDTTGGHVDFGITDYSVASTPIPPTLLLFISGLGGLGFMAWRRKQGGSLAA